VKLLFFLSFFLDEWAVHMHASLQEFTLPFAIEPNLDSDTFRFIFDRKTITLGIITFIR
jgi:hypothetical protein